MADPTITIARPNDRAMVVATVRAAFRDDPAFCYFFPGDYEAQAAAFAGLLFDTRTQGASTWVADGGDAVAMWDRPRPVDHSRDDDIEGGLADALDPDAISRILRYEEAVDKHLPQEPHWYLGILATHPDHAGRRLGRLVMRHGLIEAGRAGVPAALETTNPGNVRRYESEGWRVGAEVDVDDLHVWILRHEGIASGADDPT
jgi:GNAT superfamily N-acetyltransferase